MINYIWVAFIVAAICYAGWLDIAGKPPVERPAPAVLEAPAGDLAYDFAAQDFTELDLGVAVAGRFETPTVYSAKPASLAPTAISVQVRGDGSANLLTLAVRDRDGDVFYAPGEVHLGPAGEWRSARISLADLRPGPRNPGAKVDYPLAVRARIVRADESTASAGTIAVRDARAELPPIRKAGDKYESKSWMGVATESTAAWAKTAIELALGLVGLMMLWLGLMKIAEKAGLVELLARGMRPIMVRLFPDVRRDSPAMGSILMNMAANMLGLGNAATPFGIKAMEQLQEENPSSTTASNAQCMLLAINTSSVVILPATIFAYRAAQGSHEIMKFWPVMLGATLISTTVAIVSCKLYEKLPIFRVPPEELDKAAGTAPKENAP